MREEREEDSSCLTNPNRHQGHSLEKVKKPNAGGSTDLEISGGEERDQAAQANPQGLLAARVRVRVPAGWWLHLLFLVTVTMAVWRVGDMIREVICACGLQEKTNRASCQFHIQMGCIIALHVAHWQCVFASGSGGGCVSNYRGSY